MFRNKNWAIPETAMSLPVIGTDRVILLVDRKGARPPLLEALKNPWERALEKLEWPEPRPRFHDLRHTWRANARRSGVSDAIAEAIMGHANRNRPVNQRYGWESDEELVKAVDMMTFEHGETKIGAAR